MSMIAACITHYKNYKKQVFETEQKQIHIFLQTNLSLTNISQIKFFLHFTIGTNKLMISR